MAGEYTDDRVLDELRAIVQAAPVERLPELLGRIESVRVLGLARLTAPAQTPAPSADDPLLSLPEVAAILAVPVEHARELGRRGALPTVRVGERYVRVRRTALERFLRERERGAAPSPRAWPGQRTAGRAAAFKQRTSA